MDEDVEAAPSKSWVPWWLDPYSDNPIAFGILFMLLLVGMIGGLLLFRFLFVKNPGAHPTTEYLSVLHLFRSLRHLLRRV